MPLTDLPTWVEETTTPGYIWYVKRLSGNDTLANGTHQAGPYIQKEFLFDVFPSLNRLNVHNPEKWFELRIDSHPDVRQVRAVWYNNKLTTPAGTRNEARLTNFGGIGSALLDPESTGALTVFAFRRGDRREADQCNVWVSRNPLEEDLIEELTGVIEPGQWKSWVPDALHVPPVAHAPHRPCWLMPDHIPPAWLARFPTGQQIILKTVELRALHGTDPDLRLVKRRDCEFNIFQSVEEAVELPRIMQGFKSMEEFTAYANSIMQRRKARSGNSLELHLREIFIEEGLQPNVNFSFKPKSENDKRPDFLFPSQTAYQNPNFPDSSLRMLAVKTSCKDRWRQILNEADRIPQKHLLTLQEGVSVKQFNEMTAAGVKLVVPAKIVNSYPSDVRPYLSTLESFIGDIRLLQTF